MLQSYVCSCVACLRAASFSVSSHILAGPPSRESEGRQQLALRSVSEPYSCAALPGARSKFLLDASSSRPDVLKDPWIDSVPIAEDSVRILDCRQGATSYESILARQPGTCKARLSFAQQGSSAKRSPGNRRSNLSRKLCLYVFCLHKLFSDRRPDILIRICIPMRAHLRACLSMNMNMHICVK